MRPAGEERLLLAVRLNAQDRGIYEFRRRGAIIAASDETLHAIGLALPAPADAALRPLDALSGLSVHFDEASQALELLAPVGLLAAGTVSLNQGGAAMAPAQRTAGLVLNYDLYGGAGSGGANASGFASLRAFSGNAVLEASALADWHRAGARSHARAVRLATAWSRTWPEAALRLTVGDFVTASVPWSRPTRLAGLQIGTDFGLQPYFPTAPLPTFLGSAVLPSQVELYVDGVKRWSGDVASGPFTIGAGPGRIDGQGKAQLVMTDVMGRISTQEFNFYETPRLLRRGLSEWSAAAGAVRLDYGRLSFAYGNEPMVSASWRHGATDRLTLEAHGEASTRSGPGGVAGVAGVGAAWLLGPIGVVNGSISGSFGARRGRQWTLGFSRNSRHLHFAADIRRSSTGFADIASHWSAQPVLASDSVQFGFNSQALGAWSLGYLRLRQQGQESSRFALANFSRTVGTRMTLNASLRENLKSQRDRSLFVSLSFTPGRHGDGNGSIGLHDQGGHRSHTASYQRNAPLEGGLGWRADLLESDGRWQGQAQVEWLGNPGAAQARLEAHGGRVSVHGGFSGALALLGDSLLASRRIDDGFALVSTNGLAGVPVLVHNAPVGKTDERGLLLVTQLRAFEHNQVGIDPAALDESYAVGAVTADAVPADRAGVRIDFPVRRLMSVVMTVADAAGRVLPPGSQARIGADGTAATVGFEGMLYLEEPPPGEAVIIETRGGACGFRLPADIARRARVNLGTMTCETLQ